MASIKRNLKTIPSWTSAALAAVVAASVPTTALALGAVFDFESAPAGQTFSVGSTFQSLGVSVRFMRHQSLGGTWQSGSAEVEVSNIADGTPSQELRVSDLTVRMIPSSTVPGAKFMYADCGGNVNFMVNGDFVNVPNFSDLPAIVGGTSVEVIEYTSDGCRKGAVIAEGPLNVWRFGGQELFIDDVVMGL